MVSCSQLNLGRLTSCSMLSRHPQGLSQQCPRSLSSGYRGRSCLYCMLQDGIIEDSASSCSRPIVARLPRRLGMLKMQEKRKVAIKNDFWSTTKKQVPCLLSTSDMLKKCCPLSIFYSFPLLDLTRKGELLDTQCWARIPGSQICPHLLSGSKTHRHPPFLSDTHGHNLDEPRHCSLTRTGLRGTSDHLLYMSRKLPPGEQWFTQQWSEKPIKWATKCCSTT